MKDDPYERKTTKIFNYSQSDSDHMVLPIWYGSSSVLLDEINKFIVLYGRNFIFIIRNFLSIIHTIKEKI